jgi:predicted nuclease with TOPRIM domain
MSGAPHLISEQILREVREENTRLRQENAGLRAHNRRLFEEVTQLRVRCGEAFQGLEELAQMLQKQRERLAEES